MNEHVTDSRLANMGANAVLDGFESFQSRFNEIARRAKTRFATRDWQGMQADGAERIDMQDIVVWRTVNEIHKLLGKRAEDNQLWPSIKAVYSGLISRRSNWELAETFFNSITRRIFSNAGVDPQREFVDTDFQVPPTKTERSVYKTYSRTASSADLIRAILADHDLGAPFEDLDRDVTLAADRLGSHLRNIGALQTIEFAEIIKSIFFRRKAAYIVGRLYSGSHRIPLVIGFRHHPEGVVIDAVLFDEDDVSILFSFARSYFHVEIERPHDLVHFLRAIMPRKRIAELYISLGYHKHGKTELYRDILHHLETSNDKFEIARGQRGMVMVAFSMPSYDIIIKIIKDQFDYPKKTDHQAVKDKYRLVFRHDRAGRLLDAQPFERLRFERHYFSDELLEELQRVASKTVIVEDDSVVILHAYIERLVTPLNIYVNEADPEAARMAAIDYGHAIKELALTNIFPGDLLLKNFGVTRHGRVIFYDYDEISLLTDCKFKKFPPTQFYEDELAAEPWFAVDDDDIFPEQFPQFLGLRDDLREIFEEYHSELFDADYWKSIQDKLIARRYPPIYPYMPDQRLPSAVNRSDPPEI